MFFSLPLLQPPYLYSMHNSPIKEVAVYSNIDRDVWSIIQRVGKVQQESVFRAPCKVAIAFVLILIYRQCRCGQLMEAQWTL